MSSSDPAIRVSLADRDDAVDRLQAAYADGRIDEAELSDRTQQALQARTRGDLNALLGDLPRPDGLARPAAAPVPRGMIGGCVHCCVGLVVGICRAIQRLAQRD